MQKFELPLKNEKKRFYDRFATFIFILNLIPLFFFLLSSHENILKTTTGIIATGLLLLTLFLHISKRGNNQYVFILTATVTFFYWIIAGYWIIAIIILVLFFLYFINKRNLLIGFYTTKIEYPSFPKRAIAWAELSNVILKDGWLTIDFKNNRIIQHFIEDSTTSINEKEFNDFCRQLLNK